jgi:hypothetical protein
MIILWRHNKEGVRPANNLAIPWIFPLWIITITWEVEIQWVNKNDLYNSATYWAALIELRCTRVVPANTAIVILSAISSPPPTCGYQYGLIRSNAQSHAITCDE